MSRRANFQDQLDSMFPEEFCVLGEYVNNRTKVEILHFVCGEKFSVNPSSMLLGRQKKCSFCHRNKRIEDGVLEYMANNDLEDVLKVSIGRATKTQDIIELKCLICKNAFPKTVSSFKAGQHCPYCNLSKINKNIAKITILNKFGKDYELLSQFVNGSGDTIKVLHTICGEVTETSYSYFVHNSVGCFHCTQKRAGERRKKSHEEFVSEVQLNFGGEYEVASKYKTANENVELFHNECGNTLTLPAMRVATRMFGCKYCSLSTPERKIRDILDDHVVDFNVQYTFEKCVGETGRKLPFDFAIFLNGELTLIIEYDGQHHFSSASFGVESYKRTVRNDEPKNAFCTKNDIELHRIPYTELDIIERRVLEILESGNVLNSRHT